MQGGAAQGIGWALNEEYLYNEDGVLENPGFLDYRIPVASDLPFIDGYRRGAKPASSLWREGCGRSADCAADASYCRGGISIHRRALQRFTAEPTQDCGWAGQRLARRYISRERSVRSCLALLQPV
jgi:hypothetical protein